jgi:hypothetical protein
MKYLVLCLLLFFPGIASAHLSSDSYLRIDVGDTITGQWDIALRDLDVAVGVDANGDGDITWGEVKAKRREIEAYAFSHLTISGGNGGDCAVNPTAQLVDQHADGGYAVLRFAIVCPDHPSALTLRYRLLFDLDPTHRGLVTVNDHGVAHTAILGPDRPAYSVTFGASSANGFFSFLQLGVEHIISGRDHLLFLAVLLMPALATVKRRGIGASLLDAGALLSLFTAAHAVTVTLAALSIIEVPARMSEAAIAFSIAITAADNLWPFLGGRRGVIAFGFGLIHGLGFASALGPLALRGWPLVAALVGFNTGIELVQLTLALIAFAVVFALSGRGLTAAIQHIPAKPLLPLASLVIFGFSAYWFVDRSFLLVTLP